LACVCSRLLTFGGTSHQKTESATAAADFSDMVGQYRDWQSWTLGVKWGRRSQKFACNREEYWISDGSKPCLLKLRADIGNLLGVGAAKKENFRWADLVQGT